MKNISKIIGIMTILFVISSCENESEESFEFVAGESTVAIPSIGEVSQGFFNLLDLENAFVEFELDANGNASSMDILMNFNGGNYAVIETVSEFPSTVRINLSAVANTLSVNTADLVPGILLVQCLKQV